MIRFLDILYSWFIYLFLSKRAAAYALMRFAESHEDPLMMKKQILYVLDELAGAKGDRKLQNDCGVLMIKAKQKETKSMR